MKEPECSEELRRKQHDGLLPTAAALHFWYQPSHQWDQSANKITMAQVTVSGETAVTIKGHLRFIPSFEGRMIQYTYHTRFPDAMAAAACLWWDVWYQTAGLMMLPVLKDRFGHFMTGIYAWNRFKDKLPGVVCSESKLKNEKKKKKSQKRCRIQRSLLWLSCQPPKPPWNEV